MTFLEDIRGRAFAVGLVRVLAAVLVLAAVAVAAVNIAVVSSTQGSIVKADELSNYEADAIVVLGASVYPSGECSPILCDRLDAAKEAYDAGAAPKIIVSGDNSEEHYNESAAMKRYLVDAGVPSEDVFCDYAGFSTYETIYRAKNIFGAKRIVVATQSYHLYRALCIANLMGMEAKGVAGDYHDYDNPLIYHLREVPGRVKDVFQCLFNVPPTFEGDPISLSGSGDSAE